MVMQLPYLVKEEWGLYVASLVMLLVLDIFF